jgi:hypothetical protein
MKTKKYLKSELIWLLHDFAQKIGGTPKRSLLKDDAHMPSEMTFRLQFWSWWNALRESWFEPIKVTPSWKRIWSRNKKWVKKITTKQWYIHIFNPLHLEAMKNWYVREHRMVYSNYLWEKIPKWYEIHHKNWIKDDNRLENLEIILKSEHSTLHHKWAKKPRNNSVKCTMCDTLTASKYWLCRKHYKLERQRGNFKTPNF